MTVREYIGARYVPLYMGDWDNTKTYEPLSIVEYQGNSYTSRQYVPSNIALTNDAYWALTGNYNAQIEAYRAEVQTFDDRIDANHDAFGISYVGFYGAKENDPSVDWDTIIASIAEVSTTIDFGCGQWDVSTGLTIPDTIKAVSGHGAMLYTSIEGATIDHFIEITGSNCFINGLYFKGNGKASKLLCDNVGNNRLHVYNCKFFNPGRGNYAIYSNGLGNHVSNCVFWATESYYGGIAFRGHTDNFIENCKVLQYDYAFCVIGSVISNCYYWCRGAQQGVFVAPEHYLDNLQSVELTTDIVIIGCELDCVQRMVINPQNVVVDDCIFFWNPADEITRDCYLFFGDPATVIRTVSLLNSVFKVNTIDFQVNTFGHANWVDGDTSRLMVQNYYSAGNLLTAQVYDATVIENYRILAGWNRGSLLSTENTKYYQHLVPSSLNTPNASDKTSMVLEGNGNSWVYIHDSSNRQFTFPNDQIRTNNQPYCTTYYKAGEIIDEYLPIGGMSTKTVKYTGPAINPTCSDDTTQPDLTGYTQLAPRKIVSTVIE